MCMFDTIMFSIVGNKLYQPSLRAGFCCRLLHQGKQVILGIESSCDDSCAAIVTEDGKVLSSYQISQHDLNRKNRGVVPSVASKSHQINIPVVVDQAIKGYNDGTIIDDIDAVALTIGPGLAPCLGAGLNFAKDFCKKNLKPLVLVNHMEAHAMAASMTHQIFYPSFGFMVSGGNTEIVYIPDHLHPFLKIGDTLDDACGECMDKVYRTIMESFCPKDGELRYCSSLGTYLYQSSNNSSLKHGGAQISAWSKEYEETEEFKQGGKRIPFPLPMARQHNSNFSFSGIKTYSIRYLQTMKQSGNADLLSIQRFCYYFEHTLIKHLLKKLEFSIDLFPEVGSIVSTFFYCDI